MLLDFYMSNKVETFFCTMLSLLCTCFWADSDIQLLWKSNDFYCYCTFENIYEKHKMLFHQKYLPANISCPKWW